jgi:1-aminocyclopropane-1-carboxylate deaminase/D-cysteine desulfhydrase-like pyridoxal-dependent ACC family enzyme
VGPDYQTFIPPHPRFQLARYPSPLLRAERLEAALHLEGTAAPRIYLKRDDLLGLALGGNKIRNLEFLIGEALEAGATDVVTEGRQQSNHCRLTAAACARAGLRAHLALLGHPPPRATGNLLLMQLLGARVHFSGSDDRASREACMQRIVADIGVTGGRTAYVIPSGGSTARGATGHVLLALELIEQLEEIREQPAAIVLATATGGTQSGLLAGLQKLGRSVPVWAFAVAKSAGELGTEVLRLSNEVAREIGADAIDEAAVAIDDRALGSGYGQSTAEAQQATGLLARTEGVLADPVYTGKALAGLLVVVREERLSSDEVVVFLHTGGAPALFADASVTKP